jgi:hypothetical protein
MSKENKLHVSLHEVAAYTADYKPMPDGKPFNPQEYLDPARRATGRVFRRIESDAARQVAAETIEKIKNK